MPARAQTRDERPWAISQQRVTGGILPLGKCQKTTAALCVGSTPRADSGVQFSLTGAHVLGSSPRARPRAEGLPATVAQRVNARVPNSVRQY